MRPCCEVRVIRRKGLQIEEFAKSCRWNSESLVGPEFHRWEYKMTGPATSWAGTVSTAGDLVITGDDDGALVALDARTGEALWHFSMGNTLYASPMTLTADGKQYVTIATAIDVFMFGLFSD